MPLFTFSRMGNFALHLLNEGMDDGGSALRFLNEREEDGDYALHFLNEGVDDEVYVLKEDRRSGRVLFL